MSYWGAVSVPKWAIRWTCSDYPGFADVWNVIYARVFRDVWPHSRLSGYKDVTIGDHLEALLGWNIYLVQVHEAEFPEPTRDVLTCLEQALFSDWALYFFYS